MRCLLFAYSEIGAVGLETLLDLGDTVCGVVTHADHPGEQRWWRSVEDLAKARNIPVISPENPNTPDVLAWARDRRPDIGFSFYYRKMLKRPLLELGRLGAFNLHGSLLPKFRGRAPVNWAIIEGASETGLTLHEMVEKPDAGDIVAQEAVPILENDTARDVFEKLVPLARRLLTGAAPLLREGRAPRRKQDESQATYFGARTPADGELDWVFSARDIHNKVRGLARPYPGAFGFYKGKKIFLWKGRVLSDEPRVDRPGRIRSSAPEGVSVACGDGVYLIQEAQEEEKAIRHPSEILRVGICFDPCSLDQVCLDWSRVRRT